MIPRDSSWTRLNGVRTVLTLPLIASPPSSDCAVGRSERNRILRAQHTGGGRVHQMLSRLADQFHLSANASAALDEVLRSRRRRMEYVVVTPSQTRSLV